jgi:hypothetical protein
VPVNSKISGARAKFCLLAQKTKNKKITKILRGGKLFWLYINNK